MKVGDLVRWNTLPFVSGGCNVGIVFSICKDPKWVELQVKVLWPEGFWTQSINNLEVISESR